jgi:hypothetical protein
MKVIKFETHRSFAKKLQKATGTTLRIEEISSKNDHYHYHIGDEFKMEAGILVCWNDRNITFAIGTSNDYPDPLEFPFTLFSKLVKFFGEYSQRALECNCKDLDEEETANAN